MADIILVDFSPPTLAQAIEANQLEFLADLGRSPQVTLHEDPELTWFISGIAYPRFNRILRARFEADDLDEKIEAALAPFKARGIPMTWHTGPGTRPADLEERLTAHGLVCTTQEPGMAIDLQVLKDEPPRPAGLRIEPVRNPESLKGWSQMVAHAFGMPNWVSEITFRIEASLGLGGEPTQRLLSLGWSGGEPVGASLMFLGAGVAGLYNMATVPEARRQGIGGAMTLTALLEARDMGYRIGTLHASPLGVGIYRRLGFREYCKLARHVWKAEAC